MWTWNDKQQFILDSNAKKKKKKDEKTTTKEILKSDTISLDFEPQIFV